MLIPSFEIRYHTLIDSKCFDKFNNVVNGGKSFSLSESDLEKYSHFIDAIGVGGKKQTEIASRLSIPLYASSDSHDATGMFSSWTYFSNLDFGGCEKLKVSIKNALRKNQQGYFQGNFDLLETLRHGISVLGIQVLGMKMGLLKRDYP